MFTINCKGRLINLDKPSVMGIINITPDSFYTGNRKYSVQEAVDTAGQMIEDGATFIDIGGQSTRPSSTWLDASTELDRIIPVIQAIVHNIPEAILSIDTFYADVAKESIINGAHMINDISGGTLDGNMIQMVGNFGNVPYICMHMRGTPQTMTQQTSYHDIMGELVDFFIEKIDLCKKSGIKDVIVDPGFGFAKNTQQNYHLMARLKDLKILKKPLLVGISRKGMIYKPLNTTADKALNGTSILNTLALTNGANILRVHDVRAAIECITLTELLKENAVLDK